MARKRLVECSFLIPLRRDKNLSDGKPHELQCWDWLEAQLAEFGGGSYSNATESGWYEDPDTKERVRDESWRHTVAVTSRQVRRLRALLADACEIFQQKCIYLRVGIHVEFVRSAVVKNHDYVNLYGETISLTDLDAGERTLVNRLRRRAETKPGWCDFRNFAISAVLAFFDARGVSRKRSSRSPVFRIALDLIGRLGIAEGKVAPPSFTYRDQLERLVLQFPTRRDFCKAAGISPTMLSHVLAGRKDLSVESLSKALDRVGYRLQFTPATKAKRTG